MVTVNEVTIEAVLISILNVSAVYIAAFIYKLGWYGILLVMIGASLFTAYFTQTVLSSITGKPKDHTGNTMDISINNAMNVTDVIASGITAANRTLIISAVSSIAVLILLCFRFNFPMALGISLLSGLETMWWRSFLF